ncbi:MAG TPA: adenylate/guanylate cyclase domain-containing protein, partial [Stenomitos sp.]
MNESLHPATPIAPPTGQVTLVFTDVQGSTSLWEQHTDAMRAALLQHNAELRQLLAETGGYEVKTEGDAFMLAFGDPVAAVRWCLAAQETLLGIDWPHALLSHPDASEAQREDGSLLFRGLRVRMGVHTGHPECRQDPVTGRMDYFGPMVNRAARISGAAHGGQIVLGAEAWKAVQPHLAALGAPQAVELGRFHFKGLVEPEALVQLLPTSLGDRSFPPPKAQDVKKTNLVPSPSRFIGRERDLRRVHELFTQGSRLITLLGPGGTGKTRLSQQFGLEGLEDYPGGAWFCDLTQASTLDGIGEAVAAALGVPLTTVTCDDDLVRVLGNALAARGRTLVILDNFEQLVDHAAATLGRWLTAAPESHFLVSSRELLRLPGETAYELSPLGLPSDPSDIAGSEAVQFFVDRVRAVRSDYDLTEADAPTVAEIVRQLDGIPLAIELAAARMSVLTAAKLLERLPRRFDLLSTGRRDASERQATLR